MNPNEQGLLSVLNIQPLQEPRGMMKVFQFIFTICAFATTSSFSTRMVLGVKCAKEGSSRIDSVIDYSFSLDTMKGTYSVCGKEVDFYMRGDFSSDSEFYVAVGVLAWLYSIAALVLYCFFSALYQRNVLVPIIDLGVHGLFGILFLAASSAWASSLTSLKEATAIETIRSENAGICDAPMECTMKTAPNFSKLDISIILGFLNLFLFVSNMWFLYKETPFFRQHFPGQQPAPMDQGFQEQPPQQLPAI